jgi:hypothetical protein
LTTSGPADDPLVTMGEAFGCSRAPLASESGQESLSCSPTGNSDPGKDWEEAAIPSRPTGPAFFGKGGRAGLVGSGVKPTRARSPIPAAGKEPT